MGKLTSARALGEPRLTKHRIDYTEFARCVCGAEIVWFEGAGSGNLRHEHGCAALGWPTKAFFGYKED